MSEPRNKRLISADTVYGLIQSTNDLLRDRFTSRGRTLDDNCWRTCNVFELEQGFWKAIKDRDFGSVLTYSVMLAGRDVNVADLIGEHLKSHNEQVVSLQTSHSEHVRKLKEEHRVAAEEAGRKMESMHDTIRLQGITNSQHEQTIKDLRAKLEDKGVDPDTAGYMHTHYGPMTMGVALESEAKPELCYSVEKVAGEVVETTVIQGDPAAVKDLVQVIRAEQAACDGPMIHNVVIHNPDPRIAELVKEAASKGAAKAYDDNQKLFTVSPAEAQSRTLRLQVATALILQLPDTHDGRATWLLNYATYSDPDVQEAIRQHPRAFTSIDDAVKWVSNLKSEAPAV